MHSNFVGKPHLTVWFLFLPVKEQDGTIVYPVVDTDATYIMDGVEYSGKELDQYGITVPLKASMTAVRLCLKKVK